MKVLLIGVVGKAHGLKGEVVVHPYNAASSLWSKGTSVFALPPLTAGTPDGDAPPESVVTVDGARSLHIKAARKVPAGHVLVVFDGLTSREDAEKNRGWRLGVDPSSLPVPADDEVYHHEIIGWDVGLGDDCVVGTIRAILALPAQDVIEIVTPAGEVVMIPFVDAIVVGIDRPRRRIVVDPPIGLFPGTDAEDDA